MKLTHYFYISPIPGSKFVSRFALSTERGTIGHLMTLRQARQVIRGLGFKFPPNSTLKQWTAFLD